MLSGISWKIFLQFLLVLLFLYYLGICWLILTSRQKVSSASTIIKGTKLTNYSEQVPNPFLQFENRIVQTIQKECSRSELLYAIQKEAQKFPDLKEMEKKRIEEMIQDILARYRKENLTESELMLVWKT